ncbi:MAG: heat-inducible transcription repressor HrcA, partial [Syntrophomonadaceae bacterium]|nr:heat-inducible transcription repressor HrcA [Syntrophomonadaceae bacterium]
LEEMGYLEQPYTSAGRIPSQMGYRYFVDSLMEKENLSDEELEVLRKVFTENIHEWGEVVEKVGHFLAQLTNYTSFVIMPSVPITEFKYLQIVPLEANKALVMVVTNSGLKMHRRIDIPSSIAPEELNDISQVFNNVFTNKNFKEIKRTDLSYLRDSLTKRRNLIDNIINTIDYLLTDTNDEKVIINGVLNILNEPEFKDVEKLKPILALLEEDGFLKNIIPSDVTNEIEIKIGTENMAEEIKEMSIVLTGFNTFGQTGRIGVIGPVRMEYWKAAGAVESLANMIEELIKERF